MCTLSSCSTVYRGLESLDPIGVVDLTVMGTMIRCTICKHCLGVFRRFTSPLAVAEPGNTEYFSLQWN